MRRIPKQHVWNRNRVEAENRAKKNREKKKEKSRIPDQSSSAEYKGKYLEFKYKLILTLFIIMICRIVTSLT